MEESTLELDVSILEQTNTATPLTDVYGYAVFSESFAAKIKLQKMREAERFDKQLRAILTQKKSTIIEDSFQAVLSADTETIIRADYEETPSKRENPWSVTAFILLGVLLTGTLLAVIEKIRKGRHEDKNYHS